MTIKEAILITKNFIIWHLCDQFSCFPIELSVLITPVS